MEPDTTNPKHIKLPLSKHQYSHSMRYLPPPPTLLTLMLLGKGCPKQVFIQAKVTNIMISGVLLMGGIFNSNESITAKDLEEFSHISQS
jgi:hypothetical protein